MRVRAPTASTSTPGLQDFWIVEGKIVIEVGSSGDFSARACPISFHTASKSAGLTGCASLFAGFAVIAEQNTTKAAREFGEWPMQKKGKGTENRALRIGKKLWVERYALIADDFSPRA